MKRSCILTFLLIVVLLLTSCGYSQNTDDPPVTTQTTRILGGFPPDFIYFRSFSDIADVRNTLIQTDASTFDHTVFGDRFVSTYQTPDSKYSDKQTILNLYNALLNRSVFIISDANIRLKLLCARIEHNNTISFGLNYDCSDNAFIQIRCFPYVDPINRVTVKDSDITDILTFGEHSIVFAPTEQEDTVCGWLYTKDSAFEFRCSVDALQDLQTILSSGGAHIARLDDLVNSCFTMSFSSFDEVAAFAQAANGSDDEWLAYLSEHPIDGINTKKEAQQLLKTANYFDLLHFKHEGVHLQSITWHCAEHAVFQIELSFQSQNGTLISRSPCPLHTYIARDENNDDSYRSGDDPQFIGITIDKKSFMTFYSDDPKQLHTMHKADKNTIQLLFPMDDIMLVQREYLPTVESLEEILNQSP